MIGADILVECLKAQGVRAIFGMPGTQNLHLYDSLLRRGKGIRHFLIRHEWSATLMADGFARATGEAGVALTVPGPAATNASTGIEEAYTDCVPVLLLVGQSSHAILQHDHSKLFHGLDVPRFFEPITMWVARAQHAHQIPKMIESAFQLMRSGRPGPVVLEFPSESLTEEVEEVYVPIPLPVHPERKPASLDEIEAAVKVLSESERPLVLGGGGVISADACDELLRVVELLRCPAVTTRMGKGAIAEDHWLALGDLNGFAGQQALKLADSMLAVGVRFTQIDTRDWKMKVVHPLIHVDCDAGEIGREYPCEVGIAADVKVALRQLLEGLQECMSARPNSWFSLLQRIRKESAQRPKPLLLPQMRQLLSRDAILSVDVHSLGYRAFADFPVYQPRTFLYPCHGVNLGYAFPAALGAKVAFPDRQVVCFSGDGGFMMGAMELATAVQYGINVVVVVVNDGCLTAIKGVQEKMFGRTIDVDMQNPDFVRFAESFGARGVQVDKLESFPNLLAAALNSDKPVVIDVPMGNHKKDLIRQIPWLYPETDEQRQL